MANVRQFTKELIEVFSKISPDKRVLEAFLRDLLTPAEFGEVITRWQIVKALQEGTPQRKIAKDLGVGIATITRGSREMAKPNNGFYQAFKKLDQKK